MRITLPFPPSVNAYWRSPNKGPLAGRTLISAEGRAYRAAVFATVAPMGLPSFGSKRLSVVLHCFPPDARRRDLDNLGKGVCDSLTSAGIWDDDGQIDELHFFRHHQIKGGLVEVVIEEITEESIA